MLNWKEYPSKDQGWYYMDLNNKYDDIKDIHLLNYLVSPKGVFIEINGFNHDSYIEKMFLEEGYSWDELEKVKDIEQAKGGRRYAGSMWVMVAHFGFISVHSSGMGYGWVQGPRKISQKQIDAVSHEYVLGRIPPLLNDIIQAWNDPQAWYNQPDQIEDLDARQISIYAHDEKPKYSLSIIP